MTIEFLSLTIELMGALRESLYYTKQSYINHMMKKVKSNLAKGFEIQDNNMLGSLINKTN